MSKVGFLTAFLLLCPAVMPGQQMSDAEQRYKKKMGRPYRTTELRLEAEKRATERKITNLFDALDRNGDGSISKEEWSSVHDLKVETTAMQD